MTTDTVGGIWNYSLQLCRALRERDVSFVLATMGAPLAGDQRALVSSLDNVEVHESAFTLEWMDDPWDDVDRAGDWLLGLERAVKPDVVHLNGYAHAALPWCAPVLVVGHSCVLSWWRAVRGEAAPARWDRYRHAVRAGLRAAQLVAAPTHAMLRALTVEYGPLPHGIVIPNGCDSILDWTPPAPAAPARERRTPSALAPPIVLAAGRTWDESKNMTSLATAAKYIRGEVYVAGSDVHPVRGAVPLAGVRALGHVTSDVLRQWYRRASVFVHPSVYEPFGLAPVEAALEGCALVLGDIESLREVWGDTAEYVSPRDPAAIAAVTNSLLDDPDRLSRAAGSAQRRARTFTASRMAEAYRQAYGTLTSRARTLKGAVACVS